ncbi:MAG: hypothetical protein ACK4NW_10525 [Roseinatronobacter sp.]
MTRDTNTHSLNGMSKDQLREVLDEAEEAIAEIRAELAERTEAEQHRAIDVIEFPATRTAVDWAEVRAFFKQVLDDLRTGSRSK